MRGQCGVSESPGKNEPPAASGSSGRTLSSLLPPPSLSSLALFSLSLTQSLPADNGGCSEDGEAEVHGGSGQTENLHKCR